MRRRMRDDSNSMDGYLATRRRADAMRATPCARRPVDATTTARRARFRDVSTNARARRLASGVDVSTVGIGTMAWGDESLGFGDAYRERDLVEAMTRALERGVTFVDTAEVYGVKSSTFEQSSEHIVGRTAKTAKTTTRAFVGTKVFTVPWTNVVMGGGVRLTRKSLVEALRKSVERNGGEPYDLWSIHFPFPAWSQAALTDALAEGYDLGLCTSVGVSNYGAKQMEEAHGLLRKRGIPLVTNQVKYSVLDRAPEKSGLLALAKDLDVAVVAYSPLGGGLLRSSADSEIRTFNKLLEFIGAINGGRTAAQVALNYLVCKGAIPIPSCTSVERADSIADVMDFELGVEDVETIDEKLDYMDKQKTLG